MPRSTISRACSMPARIRSISAGAWCAWRSRISASPTRRRWSIANAAKDAYDYLGSPEGELALRRGRRLSRHRAEIERRLHGVQGARRAAAKEHGSLLPPKHILNAPTKLMKDEGYGAGYRYDHDEPDAFSGQDYFPEKMGRQKFYDPPERGFEREIRKRLEYWAKLRSEREKTGDEQRASGGDRRRSRRRAPSRRQSRGAQAGRPEFPVGHVRDQHRRLARHGHLHRASGPPLRRLRAGCGCSWPPAFSAASPPSPPFPSISRCFGSAARSAPALGYVAGQRRALSLAAVFVGFWLARSWLARP